MKSPLTIDPGSLGPVPSPQGNSTPAPQRPTVSPFGATPGSQPSQGLPFAPKIGGNVMTTPGGTSNPFITTRTGPPTLYNPQPLDTGSGTIYPVDFSNLGNRPRPDNPFTSSQPRDRTDPRTAPDKPDPVRDIASPEDQINSTQPVARVDPKDILGRLQEPINTKQPVEIPEVFSRAGEGFAKKFFGGNDRMQMFFQRFSDYFTPSSLPTNKRMRTDSEVKNPFSEYTGLRVNT